jgi:hypothetical protein
LCSLKKEGKTRCEPAGLVIIFDFMRKMLGTTEKFGEPVSMQRFLNSVFRSSML